MWNEWPVRRTPRLRWDPVNDWKRRIADRLAARAPRYNDPVEHRRARHIGEIIRERHSRLAQDLTAAPGPKYDVFSRALKIPRLLLGAMLDVLATIGWFVTLPFITRDDRALTTREQSRG